MKKIENILQFAGFILTILSAIAYLVIVYIIITGFEIQAASDKLLIFLILGGIAGVMISLSLRIQGIAFAKMEPESKRVLKQYQELIGNDKETKLLPMWAFQLINIAIDIIIKGTSIVLTLYYSISIIIEGLGDFKYFYLGIVNILLYLGLGLLSMTKAYNHYIEKEIPLINQKINKIKRKEIKDELFREIKNDGSEYGQGNGQSGFSESPRADYSGN